MFFDSWQGLGRVIIVGILAYVGLILFLRLSGKRTLAKMNAFDLVVTVALGSTLATILLSEEVALAEGLLAFVVLITLQFVVAWLSVRSTRFQNLVKAEPTLLFYNGEMLSDTLLQQRVAAEEVRAAIRAEGFSLLEEVEAVVLETDGSFSVLPAIDKQATSAVPDIANYPPDQTTGNNTKGTTG